MTNKASVYICGLFLLNNLLNEYYAIICKGLQEKNIVFIGEQQQKVLLIFNWQNIIGEK